MVSRIRRGGGPDSRREAVEDEAVLGSVWGDGLVNLHMR